MTANEEETQVSFTGSFEKSSKETGHFLVGKTRVCFLCNLLYNLWPLRISAQNTDSYHTSQPAILAHKRLTNMKFNFHIYDREEGNHQTDLDIYRETKDTACKMIEDRQNTKPKLNARVHYFPKLLMVWVEKFWIWNLIQRNSFLLKKERILRL